MAETEAKVSIVAARRARDKAIIDEIRVPPHSIEAEQAVLGGLMLDNRSWDAIADRLVAEDFYRRDHQLIFEAISDLGGKGEPSDAVTLSEWLERKGLADQTGGLVYLAGLVRDTPSGRAARRAKSSMKPSAAYSKLQKAATKPARVSCRSRTSSAGLSIGSTYCIKTAVRLRASARASTSSMR
jgi:replicative DNA helicase